MDKQCEFCVGSRCIVYCKADAAYLCLSCDIKIHSANALSFRHPRTIICDLCRSHPVNVRCLDHKMFMCQICDSFHHTASNQHRKIGVSCYTGCPSAKDLAAFFGLDSNDSKLGEEPSSSSSSLGQSKGVKGDSGTVEIERLQLSESENPGRAVNKNFGTHTEYFGGDALEFENSVWQFENNEIWMQDLGVCDDTRYLDGVNIPDVDPNFENIEDMFGNEGESMDSAFSFGDEHSSDQICRSTIQQDITSKDANTFHQPIRSSCSDSSFSISKIHVERSGSEYKDETEMSSREKVIMRYKEKKIARHEKQAARNKTMVKRKGKTQVI